MGRPEESGTGDATNNNTSSAHGAGGPIHTRDARGGHNVASARSSPYGTPNAPQQREANEVGRRLESGSSSHPYSSASGTFPILQSCSSNVISNVTAGQEAPPLNTTTVATAPVPSGPLVMTEEYVNLGNDAEHLCITDLGADGTPHTIDARGVRGVEPTSSHHYETHNALQQREVNEVGRHLEPGSSSHPHGSEGGNSHVTEVTSDPNVIPNVTTGEGIPPLNATTVTMHCAGRFTVIDEQPSFNLGNAAAHGPTELRMFSSINSTNPMTQVPVSAIGQRMLNPVYLNRASADPISDPSARCVVCNSVLLQDFSHVGCNTGVGAIWFCSSCNRGWEDRGDHQ